jgi:hypothetical protein
MQKHRHTQEYGNVKAKIVAIVDTTAPNLDALLRLLTECSERVDFQRIGREQKKTFTKTSGPATSLRVKHTNPPKLGGQRAQAVALLSNKFGRNAFSRKAATEAIIGGGIHQPSASPVLSQLVKRGALLIEEG